MGIQDSVNSMIGSVTMVAGSKALKKGLSDIDASKKAQQELGVKMDAIKLQKQMFNERLDKILTESKVDIEDTFNHPYGQATIHPGLFAYGDKTMDKNEGNLKVTLREDDQLGEPGIAKGNIIKLKKGGYR